jgi:hypothetical protein
MKIIAKHLNQNNLKAKIHQNIDALCAFTGQAITEGVLLHDCISDVFTDFEYIKYPSDYVSVETALCIAEVIQTEKGKYNALRSYSYYADENVLRFLKREEILELLLNIPSVPFHIAVSFNFKKHTSFKTHCNINTDQFIITTDLYQVEFKKSYILEFLPILQKWYRVPPNKVSTSTQPTYFTKEEILTGKCNMKKVDEYGLDQWYMETTILQHYRNTLIFELIVHLLNKNVC